MTDGLIDKFCALLFSPRWLFMVYAWNWVVFVLFCFAKPPKMSLPIMVPASHLVLTSIDLERRWFLLDIVGMLIWKEWTL